MKHLVFFIDICNITIYSAFFSAYISAYNKIGIARAQHDQITYDYEYVSRPASTDSFINIFDVHSA
jgi:hypothetical protein